MPQAGEGFLAVACMLYFQTCIGQRFGQRSSERTLVLDNQDRCAACGFHRRQHLASWL
jgi:hypothetical protein